MLPAGGAGTAGALPAGAFWNHLQVGVRIRVLWGGGPVAASEAQRPDDVVRRVQHCCVSLPESREWGADVLWLSCACSGSFCCTCRWRDRVRVGEPDVGSAAYSSAGWCQALLHGLRRALACPWGPLPPAAARRGWCQALPLTRPPACGAGSQFSHPCGGRLALGACPSWPSVPGVGQSEPVAYVRRARVHGPGVAVLSL